jgi:type III restriction enzyme
MKILLEELPHQIDAIKAIDDAFYGVDEYSTDPNAHYVYANPLLRGRGKENINIDIKMETGTGKTYVGVRTMLELHQKYGLFKFIVVVPTPAIKEGWKSFIESDYAKQHFSQYYENTQINLNIVNAGDFNSRKGLVPAHLIDFIEGDRINTSTIQVLLINAGMLNSDNMKGVYSSGKNKGKERFNQTMLSGFTKPIEALQATRPIVLIDEPHRFPRDGANYKSIESLNPQMIIRYGATFPDKKVGRGRSAIAVKDYYRDEPQYNLNAVKSFNDGLVKNIVIYYPTVTEKQAKEKLVVDSVTAKQLVLKEGATRYTFNVGDDLGFDGDVTYEGGKVLSSGLELEKGMTLLRSTMTNSYQQMIISDAIEKHFDAEVVNFMRENDHQAKVKTLSLFFIDSIKSYRDEDGWLKTTFENLLTAKLRKMIREYERKSLPREIEYLDFLKATLANLQTDVHAGYFGEDRGSGDEAIQAEVDDILKNKEKMLSFKDEKGNWNTRRFLFSKWTLREGWDNPNVFVIAKLRTSGSENSKIQEVGRGLRLPVDENGHRLQQTELNTKLAFLIGYDEKDFAKKLVSEVNSDVEVKLDKEHLTDDMIKVILETNPGLDENTLLEKLDSEGVINRSNDFKDGGYDKLVSLYPSLLDNTQVRGGVITVNEPTKTKRVKLNKDNWNKMRDLWIQFSNRYMLEFERLNPETLQLLVDEAVSQDGMFVKKYVGRHGTELTIDSETGYMVNRESEEAHEYQYPVDGMIYGVFLKRLAKMTKLQISMLHRAIVPVLRDRYHGNTHYLNEDSLNNINREFKKRFAERYEQNYQYRTLDFQASTSVFDARKDDFKDDLPAEVIGVKVDKEIVPDNERQLYEMPPLRFDSTHPEKDLLTHGYDGSITVFGKLPKRAIQVPKYTGGTTTPDFVYVVEREDGSEVYLLVETKADNMRDEDKRIVKIQKKFFEMLQEHGVEYQVATTASEVYNKLREVQEEDGE